MIARHLLYSLVSFGTLLIAAYFNWMFQMDDNMNYFASFVLYILIGLLALNAMPLNQWLFVLLSLIPFAVIYFFIEEHVRVSLFYITKFTHIVLGVTWALVIFKEFPFRQKRLRYGSLFGLNMLVFVLCYQFVFPKIDLENSRISVHEKKPDLLENTSVLSLDSLPLKLQEGQIAVLNFTFRSCLPCQVKVPIYEELQTHFKGDESIKFYTIHEFEAPEIFKEFYRDVPNAYHDYDEKLGLKLKFDGYPMEIIIDKKGVIRSVFSGFNKNIADGYLTDRIALLTKLKHEKNQ